ncbi:hypothetical protein F5Y03DRAFT_397288 [Xylaria venustula]|nr:hypothetical protein F5Y03DRAFT_397288 [Xylaria venustula]
MSPSAADRPPHMPLWNQTTPPGPNRPMPYALTPRPLVLESFNPGVTMPVSYNMQESAYREERDLSTVSNNNMRVENPVQQEWSASPERPQAPTARMSPELENLDKPNIVEQEVPAAQSLLLTMHLLRDRTDQTVDQGTEDDEEIDSNSDSDSNSEIVYYDSETQSECSSESNGTLGQELDNDTMHADGSDGVIDLQPTTEGRNSFDETTASGGVDVENSLHVSGSGKFHLGPQWQTPGANAARTDAGPEFGAASIWVERGPGHESGTEELHDRQSPSCGDRKTNMANLSESSVNTGSQGLMTDSMLSAYLQDLDRVHGTVSQGSRSYRGCRETPTSSSTLSYNNTPPVFTYRNDFNNTVYARETEANGDNSRDNDNHVSCQDPTPVDLCMSGAQR